MVIDVGSNIPDVCSSSSSRQNVTRDAMRGASPLPERAQYRYNHDAGWAMRVRYYDRDPVNGERHAYGGARTVGEHVTRL